MGPFERAYDEMVEANWDYNQCLATVEARDAAYNAVDEDWADDYDTGFPSEAERARLEMAWNALLWARKELARAKERRAAALDTYDNLMRSD